MKNLFILIVLTNCVVCYSQTSIYKPFKLIIIAPDTALISQDLLIYKDSVEADHRNSYYQSIHQMEELLAFEDVPDDMKKEFEADRKQYEEELRVAKLLEPDVKAFRYYQVISFYSQQVLRYYFNESPPVSTFQVVYKKDVKTDDLKTIADRFAADYVVRYKGISTHVAEGQPVMDVTTTLYSRKDKKILLEKQTSGDTNSRGSMWTCSDPLTCLLVNCVRTSTYEIFEILSVRQKK